MSSVLKIASPGIDLDVPEGEAANELLEACTRASINLLKDNLTPSGILAASRSKAAESRSYTRVFGRDAAICVLAMAGSGNLMLVTLLIPPVAIVLGLTVLGETLHPSAFAGLALLVSGLLILDGRPLRRLIDRARRPG